MKNIFRTIFCLMALQLLIGCQQESSKVQPKPMESINIAQTTPNHVIPAAAPSPKKIQESQPDDDIGNDVSDAQKLREREKTFHTQDEQNTVDIFTRVAPAAVFVTQNQVINDWRTARAMEVPVGSGTGFIWDKSGHVVTNFHVIDGAKTLTVTLYNQKTYPAKFVGGEPKKDIAVLKIDAPASELDPVTLPKEGYELSVGQKTLAIGNPFGLDHTLTTGIISAMGRDQRGYGGVTIRDMIQTDASINPGNSGGPLLDSNGDLIGMNTMIFSSSGASAGIGFAVPISTIRRVVPQIIRTGKAQQIGLGVSILSDAVARRNGIKGVIIQSVSENSPAAKAGLKGLTANSRGTFMGDIIIGIDDTTINNYDDLYNTLDEHQPGDTVKVKIRREGDTLTIPVQLFVLPD